MRRSFLKCAAIILVGHAAFVSAAAWAQDVPDVLQPPANQKIILQLHAQGDQIYTCKTDGPMPTWVLKAPDAKLFDNAGRAFGKHYAGPTWEAKDGSRVVGKMANSVTTSADTIPWLLITAVSHSGKGVFSQVTSIQRINTHGGRAPEAGCDAATAGQDRRVDYTADYVFFASKP